MSTELDDWFDSATTHASHWPVERVLAAKGSQRISVVIPARNEAQTIGEVVAAIHARVPGAQRG